MEKDKEKDPIKDEDNPDKETEVIKAIKEGYEAKMKAMKEEYDKKLAEELEKSEKRHAQQIREILIGERHEEPKDEEPTEEEILLEKVKKRFL